MIANRLATADKRQAAHLRLRGIGLTDLQVQCLALYRIDGLTVVEIGQRLLVSPQAVWQTIQRAMAVLQRNKLTIDVPRYLRPKMLFFDPCDIDNKRYE